MKHLLFAFLLLTTGMMTLTSCGDDDTDDLPICIQEQLAIFETEACPTTAASLGGNLAIFTFRAETVYCFNWGSCRPDKTVEIRSATCELICELAGPAGLTVCDGVPWEGNAVEESIVFQN